MRRNKAEKRKAVADSVYGDELVGRFIASVLKDGKKSTAQRVVYQAFDLAGERAGEPGVEVFRKAVENVAPLIEVRSRRVGGATYQVPVEVRPERRTALAFRWIIRYAHARSDKSFSLRLANELQAAAKGEGGSVKKKDDTHRMAESNKAFAHFRF